MAPWVYVFQCLECDFQFRTGRNTRLGRDYNPAYCPKCQGVTCFLTCRQMEE